jgi:hypothetical protein
MAACYFILKNDWATLNQKLVVVTAGSPRAVLESMQQKIHEEWKRLRPLDKLVICRIVRDKDVVPSVPPALFGFRHLDKLVYITKDGQIIVNPNLDGSNFVDVKTLGSLVIRHPSLLDDDTDDVEEEKPEDESDYDRKIKMIPRPFRDHMPDFYLYPLIKLFKLEATGDDVVIEKTESFRTASTKSASSLVDGEADEKAKVQKTESNKSPMKKKFASVFSRKSKNKKGLNSETNQEGVTA